MYVVQLLCYFNTSIVNPRIIFISPNYNGHKRKKKQLYVKDSQLKQNMRNSIIIFTKVTGLYAKFGEPDFNVKVQQSYFN